MANDGLCKYNVIANQFYLLAAYFFLIPITFLLGSYGLMWTASGTLGRAGMVFGCMYCSNSFFQLSAIVDQRFDIINSLLSFISITCFASIATNKSISGYMQNQKGWAFGFLWTAWALHCVAFIISSICNFPEFKKHGWKKCEKMQMPSSRAFCDE